MNKLPAIATLFFLSGFSAHATAGELTFSGHYEYRADQESLDIIERQVCFYPSGASTRLVPRPAGDRRLPWFCFSNSQLAAKMLGFSLTEPTHNCGIRGTATVVVSDYVRYAKEGDGNDIAKLKTVKHKNKSEPLPCS